MWRGKRYFYIFDFISIVSNKSPAPLHTHGSLRCPWVWIIVDYCLAEVLDPFWGGANLFLLSSISLTNHLSMFLSIYLTLSPLSRIGPEPIVPYKVMGFTFFFFNRGRVKNILFYRDKHFYFNHWFILR